jgi:uncharacterized protein (TIGR03435 family)
VIIGADGRIIGFDREFVPSANTLNAALEGRITTTPLKPGTAELRTFIGSGKVLLDARAWQIARPGNEHKPDFPPSYTLHVLLSQINGTGNYGGMDFWSLQGFDVKGIIGMLYNLNRIRIELPASFDDGERYDFSMVLPEPESSEQMNERFRQGVQDHFYLTATRKDPLMDVYVVTAPDRKPPAVKARLVEGGKVSSTYMEFETPEIAGDQSKNTTLPRALSITAVRGISVEGTADEFCQVLERQLDRPVVNETNLVGEFAFDIKASQTAKNDFLGRLHDQLGLVIALAQRNVEILVFNPR